MRENGVMGRQMVVGKKKRQPYLNTNCFAGCKTTIMSLSCKNNFEKKKKKTSDMKLYYGYLTRSTILQILQTLEKKDYQTFDSPPHLPNKKRDKDTIDSFYFLRT